MRRAALIVVTAVAAAALGVALATTLEGASATPGAETVPAATRVFDQEIPPCVVPDVPRGAHFAAGPGPAAPLAALRRPRTAQDALPGAVRDELRRGPVRGLHADAARRLPAAAGEPPRWAVPVDDVAQPLRLDEACLAGRSDGAAARVRAAFARRERRTPAPGLLLHPSGFIATWNLVSYADVERGAAFTRRPCAGPDGGMVAIEGLVPDGVTEVHVLLDDGRRIDVAVDDNVASVLLPAADQRRVRTVAYATRDGERHVTFAPLKQPLRCTGRIGVHPSTPAPGARFELATIGARTLRGQVTRPIAGDRCLVVGPPLGRRIDLAAADMQCVQERRLARRAVVASAVRRAGSTVISGFATPGVTRLTVTGVPQPVTVRPSRNGAFVVALDRPQRTGTRYVLRASVGDRPGVTRTVTLRGEDLVPFAMPASVAAFSVFQRPRALRDLYPLPFDEDGRSRSATTIGGRVDVRGARRVRANAWLLPGAGDLCLAIRQPGGSGSVGCSPVGIVAAGRRPPGTRNDTRGDGRLGFVHVLPDGVRDVTLHRMDGRAQAALLRDNVASIDLPDRIRPRRLTWTLADGTRARYTYPPDVRVPPAR